MTALLESSVRTPLSEALGWALVHSLWQGAAAALFLLATLAASRSPRTRYAAACLALSAALAGFVLALLRHIPDSLGAARLGIPAMALAVADDLESGLARAAVFTAAAALPWLVPLWFAGVILFQVRGVLGWMAARKDRKSTRLNSSHRL